MNNETISSQALNKELAYLLGVYLTDGSITHRKLPSPGCTFQLQVIDKEFAELALNCIKKIMPKCNGNLKEYLIKPTGFTKKEIRKYCIGVGFTGWYEFFENQTGFKHHIPSCIWDADMDIKKWFISGIMDGDGWISVATIGRKNPRYGIGVGKSEESWIYEFKQLLEDMGVIVLKPDVEKVGKRSDGREIIVPVVRLHFNVESFVRSGLFFNVIRKQNRLIKLREVFRD